MKILVLNGSPRPQGNTKQMVEAFREGAIHASHQVNVVDVYQKNIRGCLACEYCHTKGYGTCVQKDDMQEIYDLHLDYLGLEDMGVFTAYGGENGSAAKLKELQDFGRSLE